MTMTTNTIHLSPAKVRALQVAAGEHGDIAQVAMCEAYLHDGIDAEDYAGGGHGEHEMRRIREIAAMTQDEIAAELRSVLA